MQNYDSDYLRLVVKGEISLAGFHAKELAELLLAEREKHAQIQSKLVVGGMPVPGLVCVPESVVLADKAEIERLKASHKSFYDATVKAGLETFAQLEDANRQCDALILAMREALLRPEKWREAINTALNDLDKGGLKQPSPCACGLNRGHATPCLEKPDKCPWCRKGGIVGRDPLCDTHYREYLGQNRARGNGPGD